jgi:helicase
MRRIDCGISGSLEAAQVAVWEELRLKSPWPEVIAVLSPGPTPRRAQAVALGECRVLEGRRNLIVSAPTNGGKSLVGLLVLLEAVSRGRRAVLLEPLRAVAREKADELERAASALSAALGRKVKVSISTGDFRLEGESFSSPPPRQGEIVIATPERFESILRNPAHDEWVGSIDAVCVDEAHLISNPRRGPTLEYLITTLLCMPAPPRVVLLSATMGDLGRVREWLAPCDVVAVTERHPALRKEVVELSEGEDANDACVNFAREVLADPRANLLIFVYQTKSAEALAARLNEVFIGSDVCGTAVAYHAQMSRERREAARASFLEGRARCLVTTTALGMGVNLPATHVLLRDNTFPGVGRLETAEMLQMMGRAGRGDRQGFAAVLVRPNDRWKADELASALSEEKLPDLVSHFDRFEGRRGRRDIRPDVYTEQVATYVAAQLSRRHEDGLSPDALESFFTRSLGGATLVAQVKPALSWLSDPLRALAYQDKGEKYHLTVLGLNAVRSALPLRLAAGFAQLLRDLLTIDPGDKLLEAWRPLDHLITLHLLHDRTPTLRQFSSGLVDQIDSWMEAHPRQVPLLYSKWIAGSKDSSRAAEVLGSLGLSPRPEGGDSGALSYRSAYMAAFRSIVILERGQGTSTEDLSRRWGSAEFEGVEERWRDELLWLLSGVAAVLDLRSFYYHLREECAADGDRIKRVKRLLQGMRAQTFELQTGLTYCSPLGSALLGIRRVVKSPAGKGVGVRTIRRLEEAGIRSFADLARLQTEDLVRLGIRPAAARQIRDYVWRRSQ